MRLSLALPLALGLALPSAALATSRSGSGGDKTTDTAARYPFDPVCPWGRLSNGKGMLHRCITQDEARSLATSSVPGDDKGTAPPTDKKASEKAPADPPSSDFEMTVGPITAEQGEITVGRLSLPMDRYRECIAQHGGLKTTSGKVVVKFLVRAERVRAEGASVESYENVTKQAASCIAEVVDRRKVGTPSVPITGAQLTFSLRQKK